MRPAPLKNRGAAGPRTRGRTASRGLRIAGRTGFQPADMVIRPTSPRVFRGAMNTLFLILIAPALLQAGERQLKLFDQVWKLVHDEYYDPKFNGIDWDNVRSRYRPEAERTSTDRDVYQILQKMTAELKDAHTRVRPPTEAREDRTRNRIAFGFALRLVEGQYVVTQVEPKSAMAAAGVQNGWLLRRVDDSSMPTTGTRELAEWYAKAAIRDKCLAFSTVKFEFVDGKNNPHPMSAKCGVVNTAPRQESLRLAGGVLYLRMDAFQPNSSAWFTEILDAHRGASGLILDLRLNPGGLKAQLIKCLETLYARPISAGVDVSRKGKHHTWKIHGRGSKAFTKPLVVLIDELSMSSSEILAAAIEETGRGRVLGRKTPGKVLLSYEIALAGGGRLQLAIRDYRTERGRRLEGSGVVPDETIALRLADLRQGVDRDIERALEILNKK